MTTLVRWQPFRELDLMERQMRRLLGDGAFGVPHVPVADVYETPQEFVVEVEVPGFEQKDLSLEVTDHTILVKGEIKATEENKQEKTFLLLERSERTFERRFHLPVDADTDKLTATFANGVLELHAPKVVEAKPRKIAIAANK
jgi:HSP20 family protein